MRISVDRVEGDWAVLDFGGITVSVPKGALPADAGEGTRLELRVATPDGALDEAKARLERLRAKGPSADDIEL